MISFPQRQIKKNYRSITGHFPSIKNNTSVAYESKLEKAFFLTLEFDDTVESYQEQPQISIEFKERVKTYSADCYVRYASDSNKKNTLVEVKYTQELAKKKEYFDEKFQAIEKACADMTIDFNVFTEEVYPQVYIENIDFLYRYKTHGREESYDNEIVSLLEKENMTASDIAKNITDDPKELIVVSNAIWGLVSIGNLTTELHNVKVSMHSLIGLAS